MRFTTRAWNLTTHRIDPDVDEARDYVIKDLLQAGRVTAAGYVGGVGPCDRAHPRHNLTGDPYHTDGTRAVILLAASHTVTTPAGLSSGGAPVNPTSTDTPSIDTTSIDTSTGRKSGSFS